MELIWEETLGRGDIRERDYKGHVVQLNEQPVFFFRGENKRIACAELSNNGIDKISYITDQQIGSKPENWLFVDNSHLLMVSQDLCFDLLSKVAVDRILPEYAHEYQHKVIDRAMHLEYDGFTFGDYEISRKGVRGYTCKLHGKLLWKLTVYGYLYTDFFLKDGRILFGTDGQGGHFYIVDLKSGELVCDINTHGTNCFAIKDDKVYVLKRGKESAVLEISINDGIVRDSIRIGGCATMESPLVLSQDRLYYVSFLFRDRHVADEVIPGRYWKLRITDEAIMGCIKV